MENSGWREFSVPNKLTFLSSDKGMLSSAPTIGTPSMGTLSFGISTVSGTSNTSGTSTTIRPEDDNNTALNNAAGELMNVKKYFLSPEFSDITIKVGNEKFPAHKLVLACHSSVFERMLNAEMKEKQESCIDLSEFDVDSIKEVLRFLYEGKIDANDIDLFLQLSSFAHMYQTDRLKDYCESKLINSLKVDNIVKILVAVDNYGMEKLKKKALTFLTNNKTNILFNDAIDNIKNSTVLWEFFLNLAQMRI